MAEWIPMHGGWWKGVAGWQLWRFLACLVGFGVSALGWGQVAVEYGAVGGRQAAAAAAAPQAAVGAPAAATPTKRRSLAEGTRADGPNCSGDLDAPTAVSVAVGKSTLLRLPEPVAKRTVGNPDIIETRLVSAQTLYVLGAETGSTNMILQGRSGRCIVVDVSVGFDNGGLEVKVRELFPDETGVRVSSAADSIVLSGTASDALRVSQIVQLAQAFVRSGSGSGGLSSGGASGGQAVSPRVVNMLQIAAPQQVMLEVKIAEVSKSLIEKLGAELNIINSNGSWTYSLLSSFLFNPAAGGILGAANLARDKLAVQAENNEELVKILAEPNVIAISGQEGSFLAGGRIFIPVAQTAAIGGGSTITLEEKEFGVGLRFTPTVLSGGRINLRVAPEVSEVNPNGISVTAGGSQTLLPSITTRRAATTVQLMDGQTFAIGGLIKNNVRHGIKAYPFLGEVPVLGALFRSNAFQNDRTELMFVVTPRLVKPLPANYALPTDGYTEPSRGGRLFNNEMEGARPEPTPAPSGAQARGNPTLAEGGFEVK